MYTPYVVPSNIIWGIQYIYPHHTCIYYILYMYMYTTCIYVYILRDMYVCACKVSSRCVCALCTKVVYTQYASGLRISNTPCINIICSSNLLFHILCTCTTSHQTFLQIKCCWIIERHSMETFLNKPSSNSYIVCIL